MDSPLSESRALIDGDDMIPDPPAKIGTQVRAVLSRRRAERLCGGPLVWLRGRTKQRFSPRGAS